MRHSGRKQSSLNPLWERVDFAILGAKGWKVDEGGSQPCSPALASAIKVAIAAKQAIADIANGMHRGVQHEPFTQPIRITRLIVRRSSRLIGQIPGWVRSSCSHSCLGRP